MFLQYIILDLNPYNYEKIEDSFLENIKGYVNFVNAIFPNSIVRIVNSCKCLYDSSKENSLSKVIEFQRENFQDEDNGRSLEVSPSDLGYVLMYKPSKILLVDLSIPRQENKIKYMKCMGVAKEYNIPIDIYSKEYNIVLEMCSVETGGFYFSTLDMKTLIQLQGIPANTKKLFNMKCYCCAKKIENGFVCPTCLTVYCRFFPICKICKVKFEFKKI